MSSHGSPTRSLAGLCLALSAALGHAQELEPRSYTNTPVRMNFLVGGFGYLDGSVQADQATLLEDTQVESVFPLIGYARALGLFGRSGKFDVQAPYSCLQGSTEYGGQAYERDICGWGAPSAKLSLNLFGAPAISLEELPTYQQDLIVGVGLRVLMRRATRADAQRPTACAATHLQRNSRFGATLAWPLDRRNSLKFALSSGLTARSGGDYDAIAVLWQHRWGAGL